MLALSREKQNQGHLRVLKKECIHPKAKICVLSDFSHVPTQLFKLCNKNAHRRNYKQIEVYVNGGNAGAFFKKSS